MTDDQIKEQIQQARDRLEDLHTRRAESVRAEKQDGVSMYALAKKWGVAERTIRRIIDGANG